MRLGEKEEKIMDVSKTNITLVRGTIGAGSWGRKEKECSKICQILIPN